MQELWVIVPMIIMVVGFIIVGIDIFRHNDSEHHNSI